MLLAGWVEVGFSAKLSQTGKWHRAGGWAEYAELGPSSGLI